MNQKIKTFSDLTVWQEGHKLVIMIYKITKEFPKEEVYALVSQMRRAAISVTSNIAEGFSRRTQKDKVQFYAIALGSLTELENQLLIARDIEYIKISIFQGFLDQCERVGRLLQGLIKSAQSYA